MSEEAATLERGDVRSAIRAAAWIVYLEAAAFLLWGFLLFVLLTERSAFLQEPMQLAAGFLFRVVGSLLLVLLGIRLTRLSRSARVIALALNVLVLVTSFWRLAGGSVGVSGIRGLLGVLASGGVIWLLTRADVRREFEQTVS